MKPLQKQGFTLIEVAIVVAIMGIFALIAIPNFLSWLPRHRLSLAASDVGAGIVKARSKAVKDYTTVVFRPNAADTGFLAFVDNGAGSPDDDNNGIPDDAEDGVQNGDEPTVVRVALPNGISIAASFTTIFDRRGFPSAAGTYALSNSTGQTRRVVLALTGHVQVQEPTY